MTTDRFRGNPFPPVVAMVEPEPHATPPDPTPSALF